VARVNTHREPTARAPPPTKPRAPLDTNAAQLKDIKARAQSRVRQQLKRSGSSHTVAEPAPAEPASTARVTRSRASSRPRAALDRPHTAAPHRAAKSVVADLIRGTAPLPKGEKVVKPAAASTMARSRSAAALRPATAPRAASRAPSRPRPAPEAPGQPQERRRVVGASESLFLRSARPKTATLTSEQRELQEIERQKAEIKALMRVNKQNAARLNADGDVPSARGTARSRSRPRTATQDQDARSGLRGLDTAAEQRAPSAPRAKSQQPLTLPNSPLFVKRERARRAAAQVAQ
jgi:hypothetical protein